MDKVKFENDFITRLREAVKKYKEKKSKEQ
jgi:hypothetical protein